MLACASVGLVFVLVALGVVFAGVFIVRRVFKKEAKDASARKMPCFAGSNASRPALVLNRCPRALCFAALRNRARGSSHFLCSSAAYAANRRLPFGPLVIPIFHHIPIVANVWMKPRTNC